MRYPLGATLSVLESRLWELAKEEAAGEAAAEKRAVIVKVHNHVAIALEEARRGKVDGLVLEG